MIVGTGKERRRRLPEVTGIAPRAVKNKNGEKEKMNTQQTTLSVPSVVCGGCASAIKKALDNLRGVNQVDVDTAAKTVTVKHTERVPRQEIVAALDRAGFPAS